MTERRTWHVLRHRAATGVALLGAVVGLVSCSGSSGDVQSKVKNAVLQLDDFPPSWRAYPQSGDTRDVLGETATCTGHATGGKSVTTVRSPEFRHGDQHITSTGVGFSNTIAVSNRADSLGSARVEQCMTSAMKQQVLAALPGATIASASVKVQQGGVNVPVNYAGAASGSMKVTIGGKSETVFADAIFLLGTDYYVDLNFVSVGKRVSDFIRSALAKHIAVREQHTT
jgi:hypothetical protein